MDANAPDVVTGTPVERDETVVMFLRTEDDVAEIQRGWTRLEELVGLRGRKFFGAFYPSTQEYRVCVQIKEGDDPAALGLETGTLPGGSYLRVRLRGEAPQVYSEIGPTFDALAEASARDDARPAIEFYRADGEIDLLHPVAD
ncbi:MAG TPA: GyrI-like domain-containing protein [Gaiellaceae bacterium]